MSGRLIWWPARRLLQRCRGEKGRCAASGDRNGQWGGKAKYDPEVPGWGEWYEAGGRNRRVSAAVCREGTLRSLVWGSESPDSALGLPVVAELPPKGRGQEGRSQRGQSRGPSASVATPQAVSPAAAAATQMERACPAAWQTPGCQAPNHRFFLLFLGGGEECGQSYTQQRLPCPQGQSVLHCLLALLAQESLGWPLTPTKARVGRARCDPKA